MAKQNFSQNELKRYKHLYQYARKHRRREAALYPLINRIFYQLCEQTPARDDGYLISCHPQSTVTTKVIDDVGTTKQRLVIPDFLLVLTQADEDEDGDEDEAGDEAGDESEDGCVDKGKDEGEGDEKPINIREQVGFLVEVKRLWNERNPKKSDWNEDVLTEARREACNAMSQLKAQAWRVNQQDPTIHVLYAFLIVGPLFSLLKYELVGCPTEDDVGAPAVIEWNSPMLTDKCRSFERSFVEAITIVMSHLGFGITDPAFDLKNFPEMSSTTRVLKDTIIAGIQPQVDESSKHTLILQEETDDVMGESVTSDKPNLKSKENSAYRFGRSTQNLVGSAITTRSKSRSSSQADALEADSSSLSDVPSLEQSAEDPPGDSMGSEGGSENGEEDGSDQSMSPIREHREQSSTRASSKRHATSSPTQDSRQHSQAASNAAGSTGSKRTRGDPEVEGHTSQHRSERQRGRVGP